MNKSLHISQNTKRITTIIKVNANGDTIREMSHTHPLSRELSNGDKNFKNDITHSKPSMKINYNFYHTPTKTKIKF